LGVGWFKLAMDEKGYIKFSCTWVKSGPLSAARIEVLNLWRERLHKLGLIGVYENGIGYGNISVRIDDSRKFIITGSSTGQIAVLDGSHYTVVTEYDIPANRLTCAGPIKASSESLTHAALYAARNNIKAVIHVHSLKLWQELIDKVPTTSGEVEYGTPQMAFEMTRLLREMPVTEPGLVVMGGHREGLVSFGATLDQAAAVLLRHVS
jgi:L-ribulose-5-phosphate 4-epimerase